MPKYRTDTDELMDAMRQLMAKANEMEAAVQAVEAKMALARTHQAPVVSKIVKDWDEVKASFKKLFAASTQISNKLKTAAANINQAMNG